MNLTKNAASVCNFFRTRALYHDYNSRCPLGFSISAEELYEQVTNYITANAVTGWSNLSSVITGVRKTPELRWASPLELKNAVERGFSEKFGAKEAAKPKGKVRELKSTGSN